MNICPSFYFCPSYNLSVEEYRVVLCMQPRPQDYKFQQSKRPRNKVGFYAIPGVKNLFKVSKITLNVVLTLFCRLERCSNVIVLTLNSLFASWVTDDDDSNNYYGSRQPDDDMLNNHLNNASSDDESY